MTAYTTVSPTGNDYIDGILKATRWDVSELLFGFPADVSGYPVGYGSGERNTFEAFNSTQSAFTRAFLGSLESILPLTFTEDASAEIRYARTAAAAVPSPGGGTYPPGSSPASGDVWVSTHSACDSPGVGNFAGMVILHETGHALGLKHAQDVESPFPVLPSGRRGIAFTVMSYSTYPGDDTTGWSVSIDFPQTLMAWDIRALQNGYGAYHSGSENRVHRWDPSTGAYYIDDVLQWTPSSNRVFAALWDGNHPIIDLSAYTTDMTIDLREPSDTTLSQGWLQFGAQLATLEESQHPPGNVSLTFKDGSDTSNLVVEFRAGSGDDTITGNEVNQVFDFSAGGDKTLNGGGGTNTVVLPGDAEDWTIADNEDGTFTLSGADEHVVSNIRYVQFDDETADLEDLGPLPVVITATVPIVVA